VTNPSQSPRTDYLLGIDPGIENLGWGLVKVDGTKMSPRPVGFGAIKQSTATSVPYQARALSIASNVVSLVASLEVSVHIICETPGNWFNAKGEASKDSEAVQKLYWTTGAILGGLGAYHGLSAAAMTMWVVEPRDWKGQVEKPMMRQRNIAWLDQYGLALPESAPMDTSDALGLARKAGSLWCPTNPMRDWLPDNWSLVYTGACTTTQEVYELLI
jgi:hypothetical protein